MTTWVVDVLRAMGAVGVGLLMLLESDNLVMHGGNVTQLPMQGCRT